jgi:hypothetical protein
MNGLLNTSVLSPPMNRLPGILVVVALAGWFAACASGEPASPGRTPAASVPTSAPEASEPGAEATVSEAPSEPPASPSAAADVLLATELTDVRSGEFFSLADLATDAPVLLEPMAVWCANCRAQQHEVKRAHEAMTFTSVSLDIDLSETPVDLAAYADREGFDWHFAMADPSLYRLLQERFGIGATNPPLTPLIVIGPDGSVRPLEFGVGTRSAEQLIAELAAGP